MVQSDQSYDTHAMAHFNAQGRDQKNTDRILSP